MITVAEATAVIFEHLFTPGTHRVRLEEALGKVLAEDVMADRDFPPFHRVAMDGIAIRFDAWQGGTRTFPIEGVAAAGEASKRLAAPRHCLEVMTGALLPEGCDTVVRYEDVAIRDGNAILSDVVITRGQSVHSQGADAKQGDVLLRPGVLLGPSEIALLASVGKSEVAVRRWPKAAIVSTGDELVGITEVPLPYQLRRSNAWALQAALRETVGESDCFHLADDQSSLERRLGELVDQYDFLILSGGVSKGKFDFVPAALEHAGIRKFFHQVQQRPGKPFWFGASAAGKVAFALPGNPVSTFLCFYRYVRPWLLKSLGVNPPEKSAVLAEDFAFTPPLTYFLQVQLKYEAGKVMAIPRPGGGSGDFANLKDVDGFLELPVEKNDFKRGEAYPLVSFRG